MALDPSKVHFSSKFRYERVTLKSNKPFSVTSFVFPTITIDHNLRYRPYVKLFYEFSGGKMFQMFSGSAGFGISGKSFQVDDIHVTTSQISITLDNEDSVTVAGTIYYRIYAKPQS